MEEVAETISCSFDDFNFIVSAFKRNIAEMMF